MSSQSISISVDQADRVGVRQYAELLIRYAVKQKRMFILWKTEEELRSIRNLGGVDLPPTPKGDSVQYVLDGQQCLTSTVSRYI